MKQLDELQVGQTYKVRFFDPLTATAITGFSGTCLFKGVVLDLGPAAIDYQCLDLTLEDGTFEPNFLARTSLYGAGWRIYDI